MALTIFKEYFDNAYEEIFNKILVGKDIANFRFEKSLEYGGTVARTVLDFSGVKLRNVVRTSGGSTTDYLSDSKEVLTVNINKQVKVFIHDDDQKQKGPQETSELCGKQLAAIVSEDLDARILYEAKNAYQTFDAGDLTTMASTGLGIALDATTVPQMAAYMPAKLRRGAKQEVMTTRAFVVDSYAAGAITLYLLGKATDTVQSVLQNGYAGDISNAELYISENLTGEAVITMSDDITDGDTISINGITFTFKTALTPTAGEVLLGANVAATRVNLCALINTPGTTTANGVALSAANQALLTDTYRITATNSVANTNVTIVGIGSGRLTLTEAITHANDIWVVGKNIIHCYYGAKGAIDVVAQAGPGTLDIRQSGEDRGDNIFAYDIAGIKTFADGAKKFLDVKIKVS